MKKCPLCETVMEKDLLRSYNENLPDFNPDAKKLRCPRCEKDSLKGLWGRLKT